MNTVTYLEMQLANIHAIFRDLVSDLTPEEWQARPGPGQNKIGFNIWHIPRIQDHIVQGWIRNQPEVMYQPAWARWRALRPYGVGVGITLEEADEVTAKVGREETLAYAGAVHNEVLTWLRICSDDDLDRVPNAQAYYSAYAEYQTPDYHAEMGSLLHQPVWALLMRPCIGHVHRHLGELELCKSILRHG